MKREWLKVLKACGRSTAALAWNYYDLKKVGSYGFGFRGCTRVHIDHVAQLSALQADVQKCHLEAWCAAGCLRPRGVLVYGPVWLGCSFEKIIRLIRISVDCQG